jgi:hypothetical protein
MNPLADPESKAIGEVEGAFETLRKKMRGDVAGEELAAFAKLDIAIKQLATRKDIKGRVSQLLTFQPSPSGRAYAAQLGRVRVGYIEETFARRWVWYTNILRASGGRHCGVEESLVDGEAALERAIETFLHEAGLSPGGVS